MSDREKKNIARRTELEVYHKSLSLLRNTKVTRLTYVAGRSIAFVFAVFAWLLPANACSRSPLGSARTAPLPPKQYQLIYASWKDNVTTIFSCNVNTLTCVEKLSDAATGVQFIRGPYMHSYGFIQVSGDKIFVSCSKNDSDPGTIYELSLNGSNQLRKIAVAESLSSIGGAVVDSSGKKMVYASITPDTKYKGEAVSFFINKLVVHDVATGNIINRIDTTRQINRNELKYLEWGPVDGLLHANVFDGRQDILYKIDQNNSFQRLPVQINVSKRLVGQFSNGDLLFAHEVLKKLLVEDTQGKPKREMPLIHDGFHFALSPDGNYLSIQKSDGDIHNEIWIKDLRSGEEKLLIKKDLDYLEESLGLIGWAVLTN